MTPTLSRPTPTLILLCRRSDARQAEIAAAYERIDELEALLVECQSYFEAAVSDSASREMAMLMRIDEVLS
jgi:hypothetical protein